MKEMEKNRSEEIQRRRAIKTGMGRNNIIKTDDNNLQYDNKTHAQYWALKCIKYFYKVVKYFKQNGLFFLYKIYNIYLYIYIHFIITNSMDHDFTCQLTLSKGVVNKNGKALWR